MILRHLWFWEHLRVLQHLKHLWICDMCASFAATNGKTVCICDFLNSWYFATCVIFAVFVIVVTIYDFCDICDFVTFVVTWEKVWHLCATQLRHLWMRFATFVDAETFVDRVLRHLWTERHLWMRLCDICGQSDICDFCDICGHYKVHHGLTFRMHSSLLGCITLSVWGLRATCVPL